jgi:hypothetical protein
MTNLEKPDDRYDSNEIGFESDEEGNSKPVPIADFEGNSLFNRASESSVDPAIVIELIRRAVLQVAEGGRPDGAVNRVLALAVCFGWLPSRAEAARLAGTSPSRMSRTVDELLEALRNDPN